MSKAPAAAPAEGAPKKSKKMLFIIVGAVLLLGAGGGGAFFMMKKGGAHAKEAKHAPAPVVEKKPSVFSALDPFTVNLADRDAAHYLQIGLTYELNGKEMEDEVKNQMPLIRSRILLLLTSKTAVELATPEGKAKLAGELIALARQPMEGTKAASTQGPDRGIVNVHFSAFIIQ
jgi:flagellar FliL protein